MAWLGHNWPDIDVARLTEWIHTIHELFKLNLTGRTARAQQVTEPFHRPVHRLAATIQALGQRILEKCLSIP
jgi:predicted N-formylglutamate amidohydrolase